MFKPSLLALTCALTPAMASADWFFQPKVGFEVKSFKFESGNLKGKGSATMPVIGFSIVNSAGYYFDFDASFGEGDVSDFYPEDDYVERGDVSISVGYSLGNRFVVFGGINEADTQVENQKGQAGQPSDYQIVSEGLFLGLAKSFTLDKTSSITASIAAGMMTGKYESTDSLLDPLDGEGDSIGYSASLAYTKRFGKVNLSIGAKTQSYTYSNMITYADGSDLPDSTDKMTSLYVKTSYTF